MSKPDDFLAARYALGVADLSEIVTAEARLLDPAFAARVAFFDNIFSVLDRDISAVEPPAGLWARIEGAIDDEEMAPNTRTVRAADLAWEPFLPGVERKILFVDKTAMVSGVLYKVAPGASVGNHSHGMIEECLVIEGEIDIDGMTVRAGDVHLAMPGSRHGPLSSRLGALVYIRGDLLIHP